MNKLDEMWAALAAYQPKADAEGHGETWAAMCKEKTSDAAEAAWSVAYAKATVWSAADAAKAAGDAAYAYAKAAGDADACDAAKATGDAGYATYATYAAYASANADRWAQSAIDRINKLNEAQPKQEQGEPVGQLLEDAFGRGQVMWFNKPEDESMLYTTPQQRKPLTDEEIRAVSHETVSNVTTSEAVMFRAFARAIEAAHGIGDKT